jgi:hypothetical protein
MGVRVAESRSRTAGAGAGAGGGGGGGGGEQGPPIGQRHCRHRAHQAGVCGERVADGGAGGRVPQPHGVVAGGGEQGPPVR